MVDEADRANELAAMDLALRIRVAREFCGAGEAVLECEACGEPIPEKRRAAVPGCRTCVSCQRDMEKGMRAS